MKKRGKKSSSVCEKCGTPRTTTNCPKCGGTGELVVAVPIRAMVTAICANMSPQCPDCGGTGVYRTERVTGESRKVTSCSCQHGVLVEPCRECRRRSDYELGQLISMSDEKLLARWCLYFGDNWVEMADFYKVDESLQTLKLVLDDRGLIEARSEFIGTSYGQPIRRQSVRVKNFQAKTVDVASAAKGKQKQLDDLKRCYNCGNTAPLAHYLHSEIGKSWGKCPACGMNFQSTDFGF